MGKDTTHIRIERDLKTTLEQQAGLGEGVNDVIRRLLTGEQIPVNTVNNSVNTWAAGIKELTTRIENLERLQQQEKEDKKAHDHYDHHLTTQCSQNREHIISSSVQELESVHNNVHTKKSNCSQNICTSTILITPEIRDHLITKLDSLKSRGMSYKQIAEHAGLAGKGRVTEIRNGRCKSLKESEYRSLVDL